MKYTIPHLKSNIRAAQGRVRLDLLFELCTLPLFSGDSEEIHFLTDLKSYASAVGSIKNRSRATYLFGRFHLRKGDFESAASSFNNAAMLFDESADVKGVIDCENCLSEIEFKKGLNSEAIKRAGNALDLAKRNLYPEGIGKALYVLAWVYGAQGDYTESLRLFQKAITAFEEASLDLEIGSCYNGMGNINRNIAKYDDAIKNQIFALNKLTPIGDRYRIASCYNNLGLAYTDIGKYNEAIRSQETALKFTTEISDRLGIASANGNLALIYWRQGNYGAAMEYQLVALKLRQELGNIQSVGISYLMIGNIYNKQGNYTDAIKAYQQALSIGISVSDKRGIGDAYNNLGATYEAMGDFDEALKYYKLSLTVRRKGGPEMEIDLNINIGNLYLKKNELTRASKRHNKALQMSTQLNHKPGMANSLLSISQGYKLVGQLDKANEFLVRCINVASEIGQKEIVKEAMLLLVDIYKRNCDFENALKYHEQYFEIERELTGKDIKKQITDLSFKHNLEQREKEAEIERLKNVELKEALEQLKLEKERSEQLLGNQLSELKNSALQAQMNPHFVFNSLNAIQRYIWKSNPEKATEYLVSFAKLIRLILENSRQTMVSLEKDLQALDYYIQLEALRFENEFEYQIICHPSVDKEDVMIPPMILQPFVENAIIHGLHPSKKAGKLSIDINTKDRDILLISIKDNGIGRAIAGKKNAGSGASSHQSLGLELTRQRLEKVNGLRSGKVAITDLSDIENFPCGTLVEIELPI